MLEIKKNEIQFLRENTFSLFQFFYVLLVNWLVNLDLFKAEFSEV